MVLYYLQSDRAVQLVCVPTSNFQGDHPATIKERWSCPLPLQTLLCRFFGFYLSCFEWGSEVVSVRRGVRGRISDDQFHQLPGQRISRLHIEDPFILGRNLNCTLGSDQEMRMKSKFH